MYLTEEQWANTGMSSDVEIERVIGAKNARAHDEQLKMTDKEARLMWSEGISRPILLSERSIQVKIARKVHAAHRQKNNLNSLYEVLAPGSTVGKASQTTSALKEPNSPEVRFRNSDIAKFGTEHEHDTKIGHYVDRNSHKIQEKTLEQKTKDLLGKDLGSKNIKRKGKQPDDMCHIIWKVMYINSQQCG